MTGEVLDFKETLARYPWLSEQNLDCIVSPDSDGLLCGLLMGFLSGWRVRGFYDGKVLAVEDGVSARECVFLDMEIFRKEVRSIGQHMIHYDWAKKPPHWEELEQCISANELRKFDFKRNFPEKYPLGTIHLLLALLGSTRAIKIEATAIPLLFYTDGTFKSLFNYPENCLGWLKFLGADNSGSPLHTIFFDEGLSVIRLMKALRDFFEELRVMGDGKRGADKIKISNGRGESINFVLTKGSGMDIEPETKGRAEAFLTLMGERTGWGYAPARWTLSNLILTTFEKGASKPTLGRYNLLMEKRPLSLAITSMADEGLQYTLDPRGLF